MKLWAMQTRPLTKEGAARLLEALPFTLKENILRTDGKPRQQSLWAYSLLRHALLETYAMKIPDVARSAEGKPYFPKYPEIHFNISHTEGAVLVGLSRQEIGVDLEKKRAVPLRLQKQLQAGEEDFFPVWVRWEACAKCLGRGVLPLLREGLLPKSVNYQAVETFSGYFSGAAVLGEEETVEVFFSESVQMLERYGIMARD